MARAVCCLFTDPPVIYYIRIPEAFLAVLREADDGHADHVVVLVRVYLRPLDVVLVREAQQVLHHQRVQRVLHRQPATAIQTGTRVLISLWDSLMFGRVPKNGAGVLGTRPNISE